MLERWVRAELLARDRATDEFARQMEIRLHDLNDVRKSFVPRAEHEILSGLLSGLSGRVSDLEGRQASQGAALRLVLAIAAVILPVMMALFAWYTRR